MRASRNHGRAAGRSWPDRLTFAPRWLAGPGIIRGGLRAARAPAIRARRRLRAPPRRPRAARGPASGAPGPRSGGRPRRRWRTPRAARRGTRRPPAGTRSATSASNVAIARASRSSSSRPSARAASGIRSPSRRIGRRRGVVIRAGPLGARLGDRRARRRRQPRAVVGGADLPRLGDGAQRRIEVVERRRRHERLRQLGDPPHEVGPAERIELAEHVVQQQQRRAAVELGQEVQLGELEREDRGPLLPARREPGQVPAGQVEGEVVAVRPDDRGPVPDLLLGGVGQPAGQGVARRLAGQHRRVRDVAQAHPSGRGLLGRDLAVRGRQWRGHELEEPQPSLDDPAARIEERCRPRTGAGRGSRSPRGSRAGGCSAAGACGRTSPGRRRRPGSGPSPAHRSPRAAATASRSPAASPRARTGRPAGSARARSPVGPAPLTRTRLRPPLPSAPERVIATSRTSAPTRPSTRARSRPQRISSPSAFVRCERPQPSSAMASSRLVLPAALGPKTRCAPGPNEASSVAYPRRSSAVIESSTGDTGRPGPRSRTSFGPA